MMSCTEGWGGGVGQNMTMYDKGYLGVFHPQRVAILFLRLCDPSLISFIKTLRGKAGYKGIFCIAVDGWGKMVLFMTRGEGGGPDPL